MPLSATSWLLRCLTVSAQALKRGLGYYSRNVSRIRLVYIYFYLLEYTTPTPRALLHATFSNRGGKHKARTNYLYMDDIIIDICCFFIVVYPLRLGSLAFFLPYLVF